MISILCAVRNDERFIRETLDTVFAQSYSDFELIVMDGASTDRTPEIVREYAARHPNIVFRSEPDQGQWHALDKALALTKGEYLMFLCGQDGYLDPEWLASCAQTLDTHPEVSLVWGIPFNMSEDGKLVGPHYAYAEFLRDGRYGSQTNPLGTFVAKVDWRRPAAFQRFAQLVRKFTWSRVRMVLRSFFKRNILQKEDWFPYWLRTGRAFPEGNFCVRKSVFLKTTKRFPEETMTNAALFDFCYAFNADGYLSYGLPRAASFGRSHAVGQALRDHDAELTKQYYERIALLRARLAREKTFRFIDPSGVFVSERTLSL